MRCVVSISRKQSFRTRALLTVSALLGKCYHICHGQLVYIRHMPICGEEVESVSLSLTVSISSRGLSYCFGAEKL